VQVNGKLRARIHVAASAGEEEIRTKALAEEKVIQHLAGLQVKKIIVVPQKLVSIVAK
jgi:leucyl-tRNA synthetase